VDHQYQLYSSFYIEPLRGSFKIVFLSTPGFTRGYQRVAPTEQYESAQLLNKELIVQECDATKAK